MESPDEPVSQIEAASPFLAPMKRYQDGKIPTQWPPAKPLQAHLGTWIRSDLGVRTFQGLGRNGPVWTQAVRRVTCDLHTH